MKLSEAIAQGLRETGSTRDLFLERGHRGGYCGCVFGAGAYALGVTENHEVTDTLLAEYPWLKTVVPFRTRAQSRRDYTDGSWRDGQASIWLIANYRHQHQGWSRPRVLAWLKKMEAKYAPE